MRIAGFDPTPWRPASSAHRCTTRLPTTRWPCCTRSAVLARSTTSSRRSSTWRTPRSSPARSSTSMVVKVQDTDILRSRLTRDYGLRHPFVGAGMAFIAHEQLAAAVSNAGGLGVLGASPDPAESLPLMVERTRALTSEPIGVDFICADTGFGPASTDEHIDVCIQLGVPLVVFHHDPPPSRWVTALHASGARVWMQASSKELAQAAV